jgi:MoaA/NifB/PqqE/SkfB family radical SAM enzyme
MPGIDASFPPDGLSPPPGLIGYTYKPEDAYRARDNGKLLAMRVETNTSCNLRCRYCYAQSGKGSREADSGQLRNLILQGEGMGLKSVVVIGGGEPTLYSGFRDLISHIDSLGIIPVVFTNTLNMTGELARFLFGHHASVMGKLDSLRPPVQDFLAGRRGTYAMIREGLRHLMEAGFAEPHSSGELRLGVSFVCNRLNIDEIEPIWHFSRENHLFPNMEILTPTGRAKTNLAGNSLDRETIRTYKLRILDIDRTCYGYDWLPYTPLAGSGCLQHLYSLYITIDGSVRPCAPVKFDEHPGFRENGRYPYTIHRMPLREIFDSELFAYVRTIDRYLDGKCRDCPHHKECIGCRGYAYSVGVNRGMNPLDALRMECQQCFR